MWASMGLTRAEDESPGWELVRPRGPVCRGWGQRLRATARCRDWPGHVRSGAAAHLSRLQSPEGEGFWRKKGEAL